MRFFPDKEWNEARYLRKLDLLSLPMFQPEYIEALLSLGKADAKQRTDEVIPFLTGDRTAKVHV